MQFVLACWRIRYAATHPSIVTDLPSRQALASQDAASISGPLMEKTDAWSPVWRPSS